MMHYYVHVFDLAWPLKLILLYLLHTYLYKAVISSDTYDNGLLVVHMDMKSHGGPLRTLTFCKDCHDPELEGSFVHAIIPKHLKSVDSVTGELLYAVPNHVNGKRIYNANSIAQRVVLVTRGEIPILEKCLRLKEHGVKGVIIADDGRCSEDFSFCGSRAGRLSEGGIAPHDDAASWLAINFPVFLVSLSSAERLRGLMEVKYINIPAIGMQNITLRRNSNGNHEEL
jgi:hypothetical protein